MAQELPPNVADESQDSGGTIDTFTAPMANEQPIPGSDKGIAPKPKGRPEWWEDQPKVQLAGDIPTKEVPEFDPSKPYEVGGDATPEFDPSKPFDVVNPSESPSFLAPISDAARERAARGNRFIDYVKQNVKEHFDEPLGMSDETAQLWREHGIFSDPATGRPGLLPREDEAAVRLLSKAGDAALRALTSGVGIFGQAAGLVAGEFGAPEPERLGREISAEVERRLTVGDMGRLTHSPEGPLPQKIGTRPSDVDFGTAAENVVAANVAKMREAAPGLKIAERPDAVANAEQRLRDLWETRGIHPSEAAHDAQADSFQRNELQQPPEPPLKYDTPADAENAQALGAPPPDESEQPLRAVGAEVTTGPLPDLAKEPPQPSGRLVEAGREAVDQFMGLARNTQYLLDPMATGSNRAMVVAKDAISVARRIRWEHAQADANLVRDFKPEQLERMWNALDEESVARQLGESLEHQGLVTLDPKERAAVEALQGPSQATWLQAIDAGMVESEGLPAYTPRMVLNMVAAGEHGTPQTLNELGRNVFDRVAQMKHRKYMMAEETEAAAQQLVRERLTKRGDLKPEEIEKEVAKVQIARNIRALPLATAKLQEAIVWHDMIKKIEDMGKATGSETVAEFDPGGGWFTVAGHPSFVRWKPALELNPVTGKWGARTDDSGRAFFTPRQLYMSPEFKGPMRAILDESANKNVLVRGTQSVYGGLMALKGKSMTAILNSPLIHNAVVWSKIAEAAGGREFLGFGLYGRGNRMVNSNLPRARELIERGLNPIGKRGSYQDITAMMEQPDILAGYHKSWTGKILGLVPGLFDEGAGTATERAIAKAGNFVHNTLLWDRIHDVQFGLADHLSDRLVAKGADRFTADTVAAHFSNIIVGSIPKEAMSAAARASANMMMFSRSFTLGNLSVYKQATLGLPKPLLAQIEDHFGISAEAALGEEAAESVKKSVQWMARKKALSTLGLSVATYYAGNALLQHGFNAFFKNESADEQLKGYARRYNDWMTDVSKDPSELRHIVGRLSPVYDNEPGKQDRVHIGYDRNGTALYARNPVGKYGEELVGYPTHPMTMLRQKLNPPVAGLLDILENDKGFGRKIYDENDTSSLADAKIAWAVAKHMVMKFLPEQQIMAAIDLLQGQGDQKTNALRLVGPALGFTVSQGAPGGMARGEQLDAKKQFDARFNLAWPDIRSQIQRGEVDAARDQMNAIGVPIWMQRGLIRNATNPAGALHGKTLKDFFQYATPEQQERFNRAREQQPGRPQSMAAPPPGEIGMSSTPALHDADERAPTGERPFWMEQPSPDTGIAYAGTRG